MKVLTWNIEGLKRNSYNLQHFVSIHKPDLVFLSEPQIYSCDLDKTMSIFSNYSVPLLNSADIFDPSLPLEKSRAKGGTLAMWKTSLDPYVTPLDCPSPSILPLLINKPGFTKSCHVGVYMPTAGQDEEFVNALSDLETLLLKIRDLHGEGTIVFIRGDMNASSKNVLRSSLLDNFLEKYELRRIKTHHPSYHHFLGYDGQFDSDLDVLLHSDTVNVSEELLSQECRKTHPLVNSLHDILISSAHLPVNNFFIADAASCYKAPIIANDRIRILWSDEGIERYKNLLEHKLDELASRWCSPHSLPNMSILISATNSILNTAAKATNKFVDLSKKPNSKPKVDPEIASLRKKVLQLHKVKHAMTPGLLIRMTHWHDSLLKISSVQQDPSTKEKLENAIGLVMLTVTPSYPLSNLIHLKFLKVSREQKVSPPPLYQD